MELVTPHLKSVLKNYQHSATNSLHGPGTASLALPDDHLDADKDLEISSPANASVLPFPVVQQFPILTQPDTSRSERTETILEGETITCFVVGGEKRLCLPQVLNSVLREFTLHQINQECDRLQIYCSRCTPEQLNELKNTGILPHGAPSCGLITKTDAERLCSALLHSLAATMSVPPTIGSGVGGGTGGGAFRVYHECFGKCTGVCRPVLFGGSGRCIECVECRGLFTPKQFVCHAHRPLENRTCHWGFDSSRWRSYLHISRDEADREKCGRLLDALQERLDAIADAPAATAAATPTPTTIITNGHKRKQLQLLEPELCKSEPLDLPLKKSKLDEYAAYLYAASTLDPLYLHAAMYEQLSNRYSHPHHYASAATPVLSTFRSTTSSPGGYTSKSRRYIAAATTNINNNNNKDYKEAPPVLQHPERVVPLSESERFERTYQPNVALATPLQPPPPPITAAATTVITTPKRAAIEEPPAAVDSTVSVVQRYNSEIELSTDTDDSLSDMSAGPRADADVRRVADALSAAAVSTSTRDIVLDVVHRLANEHCRALQRVAELERRLLELETAAAATANSVSEQIATARYDDVTSSRTEDLAPESDVVLPENNESNDAAVAEENESEQHQQVVSSCGEGVDDVVHEEVPVASPVISKAPTPPIPAITANVTEAGTDVGTDTPIEQMPTKP